jgi:UDP-GlcNAc:undecaprenyl-phosphate GlcNAc-1-phosphate transferase
VPALQFHRRLKGHLSSHVYSILFLAGTSFICCLLLTPLVRTWSRRNGLLDEPNTGRKLHASPVPRTGGIAIIASYVMAVVLLMLSPLAGATSVNLPLAVHLLPAVGVIFAIGLLDDVIGLNPREKLIGQAGAACLAYWGGAQVPEIAGFTLGWWSLPVTVLWLVACANAFNLIDGVDGLSAGIGLFATFTILAAALLQQNAVLALATAPLLGALLAFLRYNFNPASIFLGDCGSLTLGFLLGCFGTIWSQKSATLLGMVAPLMALAVPLLDTGLSIVRRFLRHQPIFSGDRNHIHHRLLDRGFSPRKVVLVLYGACGLAAACSLLASMPQQRFDGLLLVVFCGAAWVGVQLVGYVEFDTARRLVLTGTFRHILNARLFANSLERKVAAAVNAEDYWEIIRDVGRELGCADVRMALTGTVYESHDQARDSDQCCTIRIPLSHEGYVNFKYPVEASARHTVVISSIAEILQRSLASPKPQFTRRREPMPWISAPDASSGESGRFGKNSTQTPSLEQVAE